MLSAQKKTNPTVRRALLIAIAIVAVIGVTLVVIEIAIAPTLKDRAIKAISQRFDSDVQIDNFGVSLFPCCAIHGSGLVIRRHDANGAPPFISIRGFSADAGLFGIIGQKISVHNVRLEGLQINVPPGHHDDAPDHVEPDRPDHSVPDFVIDEVRADGTLLRILPKKPGKLPLEFEIRRLELHSAGVGQPMRFQAELTNAKPPGLIRSSGHFGPWSRKAPVLTPVDGNYTFDNADLSVFKGIAGKLSSKGSYRGILERIDVQGTTETPDFQVSTGGHPVRLRTEFHAIVDGSDGDTLLQPVTAHFGGTTVIAKGAVENHEGIKGKNISLDVTVEDGRIEDLLRLTVKADQPMMTGEVGFHAKFDLPPGEAEVMDRLHLAGAFDVGGAEFSSDRIQKKVESMSQRGRGEPEDPTPDRVVSDIRGSFVMDRAAIAFSSLSFAVPGAQVHLSGTYGLKSENMDFHGELRLDAKLSETTTGWKSFLLKVVDPLFSKKNKAGAVVPIKITGTRNHPSFGL